MKSEQSQDKAMRGMAGWYRNKDGELSPWRALALLFILLIFTSTLVAVAGAGSVLAVTLVAILGTALVHALILTPMAMGHDARQPAKARAAATSGMTDTLTRLPNRRAISAALLEAMTHAERYGVAVSVAIIDVDALTRINREHGRKAGDLALQGVATTLGEVLRMPDRAARYSDGEFMVVMPHTKLANATRVVERIRKEIAARTIRHDGKAFNATVSIGVAQYKKGEDLAQFIARVDDAVNAAQKAGRDRVVVRKDG